MVEKNQPAPDFTLDSDDRGSITLSELRGRKVVLYFYPKDDTSGCTLQACAVRDALPRFEGVDAVVLGVSADSIASHQGFRERHDLNFPLLADVGGAVSRLYGVWGEHVYPDMTVTGIKRSTFLIDEEGIVREIWRGVEARGHTEMLLEFLEA